MYTLFIANKNYSSWSLRPWILMHALDIPFQEKQINFETEDNWLAFKQFAPNGKVPCLHDDDQVIWDSFGITEFLADRHAGIWPQHQQARDWARCASAEMHAGFQSLRQICPMHCGFRIQLQTVSTALQHDLDRLDELWSEGLRRFGGPFLAGEYFTAVDAFFAPVIFRVQTYDLPLSGKSLAYVQRQLQHPSMRAWESAALTETACEPAHERAALASGELLADYREQKAR